MAWRNYRLTKKSFRFYEDGFHSDGRVFVKLPKNNIYPEDYGFSVNPNMVDKNCLYMADDYKLDICIDEEVRTKGERYKHFKITAKQLYEEIFFKYEVIETVDDADTKPKIYGYARLMF